MARFDCTSLGCKRVPQADVDELTGLFFRVGAFQIVA